MDLTSNWLNVSSMLNVFLPNLALFPQPKIVLVTVANQNDRKLLSSDLVNTKENHAHLRKCTSADNSFLEQPYFPSKSSTDSDPIIAD